MRKSQNCERPQQACFASFRHRLGSAADVTVRPTNHGALRCAIRNKHTNVERLYECNDLAWLEQPHPLLIVCLEGR